MLAALVVTASAAVPAAPAAAEDDRRPGPERSAATLAEGRSAPLVDQVAQAIGGLGREKHTDVYAGLSVNTPGNAVTVYATDRSAAADMIATALKAVPDNVRAAVKVTVAEAPYSKKDLWKARNALWAKKADLRKSGFAVHSIGVKYNGTGLTAYVENAPSGKLGLAIGAEAIAGVPVEFRQGAVPGEVSREDDEAPWWGGAYIQTVFSACTSAFGMVISGLEYLMTADHCFDLNSTIRDGGWDTIGEATRRNILNDALGIRTDAGSGVWVTDSSYSYYNGSGWNYNGQYVCHSGFVTAVDTAMCGIQVIDDDVYYEMEDGLQRHGVLGTRCGGCLVVDHGDSGGPVYTFNGNGLQSRGILSAAGGEVDGGGYEYVWWTETPYILSAFGGTLITGA